LCNGKTLAFQAKDAGSIPAARSIPTATVTFDGGGNPALTLYRSVCGVGPMAGMDWNQITALATIIGVIGGLISVAFVVYEIRRNAQAIEGATVQSLMSLEQQVFTVILTNAQVYLRGCAMTPDMTDTEKLEFTECVGMIMSMTYSAYVQHQQNLIDDEVWEAYQNAARARLGAFGFARVWQQIQMGYPRSFRAAMEPLLAARQTGQSALHV
jgi:hypothetical protein